MQENLLINISLLKERRQSLCERFFLKHENLQTINEFLPNKSAATYDFRIKCTYNNYTFVKQNVLGIKPFLPQIIAKLSCNWRDLRMDILSTTDGI